MKKRIWVAAAAALALAACQDQYGRSSKHLSPIPPATMSLMASKGMSKADPIVIRAYKKESELEVWKRGSDGRFALLKTYPICRWSGQLGPKVREGDRQAPEGFYAITPAQMNPNSSYHLSFDTGYPNAFDRAHGRTGSHLMVHGSCSSRGCYAMTDEIISEVFAVARESFAGGQRTFQFQAYPFRMTAENMARHRADPHIEFWRNLKEGSDYFEVMREEPKVAVCSRRYVFGGADAASCAPQIPDAVAQKRAADEQKVADLVARGIPAIKLVYDDGGGHQSFRQAMVQTAGSDAGNFPILDARPRNLGQVSRPEALANGPREVLVEPGKPKPSTALAYAAAERAGARLAQTAPAQTAPAAAAAQAAAPAAEKSLYDRVLGGLFGSTAHSEAAPQPAAAPVPPRRNPDRRAQAPVTVR
jgi:murein L,D-transpeptidase YafK